MHPIEAALLFHSDKEHNYPLFIYGTLSPILRSFQDSCATFVGEGTVAGELVTQTGLYPCYIDGEEMVRGEVWLVPEETLSAFDEYESNGWLYRRRPIKVAVQDKIIDANIYEFLNPYDGVTFKVKGNNWNNFNIKDLIEEYCDTIIRK